VGQATNGSSLAPTVGGVIVADHVSTTTVEKGQQTCLVGHRIVWCPPEMEGYQSTDAVTVADQSVQCAPDCSVHPRIKGNLEFPMERAMSPWSLRAIKETIRRLYQHKKHSKSTLRLRDFAATLSKCLREIWVCFWAITLSICSCALFFDCVHVVAVIVLLCACCHSLPYSKFDCDHLCKALRDSKLVEIPHKRVWYKEKYRDIQVWSLDH
jgi:hypothetical protein